MRPMRLELFSVSVPARPRATSSRVKEMEGTFLCERENISGSQGDSRWIEVGCSRLVLAGSVGEIRVLAADRRISG